MSKNIHIYNYTYFSYSKFIYFNFFFFWWRFMSPHKWSDLSRHNNCKFLKNIFQLNWWQFICVLPLGNWHWRCRIFLARFMVNTIIQKGYNRWLRQEHRTIRRYLIPLQQNCSLLSMVYRMCPTPRTWRLCTTTWGRCSTHSQMVFWLSKVRILKYFFVRCIGHWTMTFWR